VALPSRMVVSPLCWTEHLAGHHTLSADQNRCRLSLRGFWWIRCSGPWQPTVSPRFYLEPGALSRQPANPPHPSAACHWSGAACNPLEVTTQEGGHAQLEGLVERDNEGGVNWSWYASRRHPGQSARQATGFYHQAGLRIAHERH